MGLLINRRRLYISHPQPVVPDYVDLGLTSGRLWAVGNIVKDANGNYKIGNPEDEGAYFTWGDIVGYNRSEGYHFTQDNYNNTAAASISTSLSVGNGTDMARNLLGEPWFMPFQSASTELINETDQEWVTDFNGSGMNGTKFMKKADHSVYIFIPASGYINNTTNTNRGTLGCVWEQGMTGTQGRNLDVKSSGASRNARQKYCGLNIRPVRSAL